MSTIDRQRFEEMLESHLDGELSPADARKMEAYARFDPDAGRELRLARIVRHRLQMLPPPVCPPDVTGTVLQYARREARRSLVERVRIILARNWTTVVRPSIAVGMLAAIVFVGALSTRPVPDQPYITETAEDVERALDEAKWVLSYLSDIGRKAATSIRDDVLEERVVEPVNRALDAAFDDEAQPHSNHADTDQSADA